MGWVARIHRSCSPDADSSPDRMATHVRPGAQVPNSRGLVLGSEISRSRWTAVAAFFPAAGLVWVVDGLQRGLVLRSRTDRCIPKTHTPGRSGPAKGKRARGQRRHL